MITFHYECKQDGDLNIFTITGFMFYNRHHHVIDDVAQKIKELDEQKHPYRVLFDLRGLKAVEPRMLAKIKELDKVIYESKVTKVALLLDSIIARMQQKRTAESEYYMENGAMFSNYGECMAWLNDPVQRVRPENQTSKTLLSRARQLKATPTAPPPPPPFYFPYPNCTWQS